MRSIVTYSPYLLPNSSRPSKRVQLGVWRRSLPRRRLERQTVIGLASWLIVGMLAFWSSNHHQITLPASVGTGTALAAQDTSTQVNQLAAGPSGGVLPPGVLAPAGTYRNSYSPGQCTWYVAGRRPLPNSWGNARSWYYQAHATGWRTGLVPAVGAIAWTPSGYYGHVALVVNVNGNQVEVSEMNYDGPYRVDERWTNASAWQYIY